MHSTKRQTTRFWMNLDYFCVYVSFYTPFHRTTESSGRCELFEWIQRCERNARLRAWSDTRRQTGRRSHDGVTTWLCDHVVAHKALDWLWWLVVSFAINPDTITLRRPSPYGGPQPRTKNWKKCVRHDDTLRNVVTHRARARRFQNSDFSDKNTWTLGF